jgi:hypothetical protein
MNLSFGRIKYVVNCSWLILPVLVWNIVFAKHLPPLFQEENFWKDIPPLLSMLENVSRIALFAFTFLMPLNLSAAKNKKAWGIYLSGLIIYWLSWLLLMKMPQSAWSQSLPGIMAPAYTPILWLWGLWRIGGEPFVKFPFSTRVFPILCLLFLFLHNLHTFLIFERFN